MQLVTSLQCTNSDAERVGRLTVLPILLSGVLPYAQPDGKALEELLLNIMQSSKEADGIAVDSVWAVKYTEVNFIVL